MNGIIALGALCGLTLAAGILLVWARLPFRRTPTLTDRLAPYVRDAAPTSTLLQARRHPQDTQPWAWTEPLLTRAAQAIDTALGGSHSVARRLTRSGQLADVAAFRVEQVVWGAAGAFAGLGMAALLWARRPGSLLLPLMALLLGTLGGILLRDHELSRAVNRREQRIIAEFPTVAELLALSVSAGEGTAAALERVCRLSSGELADELRRCLADARAGATLPVALQGMARRTGLPALGRFIDGVVIALERGTPLADVLRAQAQDAREEGRREVMETAGRKEILMLLPVVFLVLPVTVLFAVYPGLIYLRLTP
ncbi:type II secretion system F family protein [Austwickia chelonae]|uniref:type II secretion system F family protein n=1 Tax=Austwickia chelonae TaxID=100225 RepID=UPI000E277DFE|nr:type II secretion system F family protein [Austwickia chelonae]